MVDSNHRGEVVFDDVTRAIQSRKTATIVLDHCSFVVESGKLTVLIGPSGCGKTKIINLIAGYEKPDRGKVLLDGKPVTGPDWERLVVFQETALFPWLTCYDNVMFGPLATKTMSREEAHEQTLKLLEKVGLQDFMDNYPMQLSGGMQRRAELARALINRPTVMLMDEPFRGLDAMTRELMQAYYLRLVEEAQGTHLFVTSEIEEAIFLADKLIIMTDKPSRVKHSLEIDLPRPREASVLMSKRYLELKTMVLDLLHEEAVKASQASAKVDIDIKPGLRT
jgi:NitT/TauT family transport system ATP-binding protein